jgi:hypothetical protein
LLRPCSFVLMARLLRPHMFTVQLSYGNGRTSAWMKVG